MTSFPWDPCPRVLSRAPSLSRICWRTVIRLLWCLLLIISSCDSFCCSRQYREYKHVGHNPSVHHRQGPLSLTICYLNVFPSSGWDSLCGLDLLAKYGGKGKPDWLETFVWPLWLGRGYVQKSEGCQREEGLWRPGFDHWNFETWRSVWLEVTWWDEWHLTDVINNSVSWERERPKCVRK